MSRGAFIGVIVGSVVALVALLTGGVLLITWLVAPPPAIVAAPGQETFEALRLSDSDVASLGWDAASGGHQPRTLASAATSIPTAWRNAKGTPEECAFAGGFPGESLVPAWGTEDAQTPLWLDESVSATQQLSSDASPLDPVKATAWVTYRTFESAEAASGFLAEHDALLAGCPAFETSASGFTTTTVLEPLSPDALGTPATGWTASTAEWHSFDSRADSMRIDVEVQVLDVQRGAVVARVVVMAPAGEADVAGLAAVVADVMTARLTE